MQTITLHSHIGADGVLQLPPNFANTDVIVTLKLESESSSDKLDAPKQTRLINKGGILMARGKLLGDVSNIVQQDRERRLAKLRGENDL